MGEQSGCADVLFKQEYHNTDGSVSQTVTTKLMGKITAAFDVFFYLLALKYVLAIRESIDDFGLWVFKKEAIWDNMAILEVQLQDSQLSFYEREEYNSRLSMLSKEFFEITINLVEKDLSREAQHISQRCVKISRALIDQYNAFCREIVSLIPESNQNPQLLLSSFSLTIEHAQQLSDQYITFSGISSPAFNDALTWQRTARNMLPEARTIAEDAGASKLWKRIFLGIFTLYVTPVALLGGVHASKEYKEGQEIIKQFDDAFLNYMESLKKWKRYALGEKMQEQLFVFFNKKYSDILAQLELLLKEISNVAHFALLSLEKFIDEAISKAQKQIQIAEVSLEELDTLFQLKRR